MPHLVELRVCADCMQLVKYDDDSTFDDEDEADSARKKLAEMTKQLGAPFREYIQNVVHRNAGQRCGCCERVSDALFPVHQ